MQSSSLDGKKRAQGRARYVVVYGASMWGLPMFVIMTFLVNRQSQFDLVSVGLPLVIWLLGGTGIRCLGLGDFGETLFAPDGI